MEKARKGNLGFLVLTLLSLTLLTSGSKDGQLNATKNTLSSNPELNAKYKRQVFAGLPFYFEPNQGQLHHDAAFEASGPGYRLQFFPNKTVINLSKSKNGESAEFRMSFADANPSPTLVPQEKTAAYLNKYQGPDAKDQYLRIPTYSKLKTEEIYPGIDVVYYGKQRRLEYDIVVKPNADPKQIKLSFAGVKYLRLNDSGDLIIKTENGEVIQHAPISYQTIDGKRKQVTSRFILADAGHVSFQLGEYDKSQELIIDPVVDYSTFYGTTDDDWGTSLAVDSAGAMYLTMDTGWSSGPNAYWDVSVNKFDAAGAFQWQTMILTGSANAFNESRHIVSDGTDVYVAGWTDDTILPVTAKAYQNSNTLFNAVAFGLVMDATGTITYATYLGGTDGSDIAYGITADGSGKFAIVGETTSTDLPVTAANAYQTTNAGGAIDTFLAEFDPSQATANATGTYITYFGSTGGERADAVITKDGSNYLFTGTTDGVIPIVSGYDNTLGGATDAFIVKINTSQSGAASLIYSSYFGGSGSEEGFGIEYDGTGKVYLVGETSSADLPMAGNTAQSVINGGIEIFVSVLDIGTNTLDYSTFHGGGAGEPLSKFGNPIGVDANGLIYVGGTTGSADLIMVNAVQGVMNSPFESFIAVFDPAQASSLVFSDYYGGGGDDYIADVVVEPNGTFYVSGMTMSNGGSGFPISASGNEQTTNASTGGDKNDGFFARFFYASPADVGIQSHTSGLSVLQVGGSDTWTITVINNGPGTANNVTVTNVLPANMAFVSASAGCTESVGTVTCVATSLNSAATTNFTVTMTADTAAAGSSIVNTASVVADEPDTNSANDSLSAAGVLVPSVDLSVSSITPSTTSVTSGSTVGYTVLIENTGPDNGTNIAFTAPLPATTTFDGAGSDPGCSETAGTITCTIGAMTSGTNTNMLVSLTTSTTGSLTFTPTVSGSEYDPATGNDSATDNSVNVVGTSTNLSLGMSPSAGSINVNTNVTYTITVTELGVGAATNVTVVDALPANMTYVSDTGGCVEAPADTLTCNLGALALSGTTNFTITATAGVGTEGTLANSATVSATEGDSDSSDNMGSTNITVVPQIDVQVTGHAGAPNPVSVGNTLSYTISVINNGPSTANNVTITDVLPGGVTFDALNSTPSCSGTTTITCNIGSLASAVTGGVVIAVTPSATGTLNNTATVSADEFDTNSPNDSLSAAAVTVNSSIADMAVTTHNVSTATALIGDQFGYTITVTNNGPDQADNVTITDTLPVGVSFDPAISSANCSGTTTITCTIGTLASGASDTAGIGVTATSVGTYGNSATVTTSTTDGTPGNDTLASGSVVISASADVGISSHTASATIVTVGDNVTYTITATNNGPSPATNVTIADTLPVGTTYVSATPSAGTCTGTGPVSCNVGTLNVAASATVVVVVTTTATGSLSNSVAVAATEADVNTANDSDVNSSVTVNPPSADLSVSHAGPNGVLINDPASYTITVSNNGPDTSTGLTLTYVLDANLTFVSATSATATCAGGATTTCTLASLVSGASFSVDIVATAPATLMTVTNSAAITATTADPNAGNNNLTANTIIADTYCSNAAGVQADEEAPVCVVGSSAGGGGSMNWAMLLLALMVLGWRQREQIAVRIKSDKIRRERNS